MRYLLALLSVGFLLMGCTGGDTANNRAIAPEGSSEDSPAAAENPDDIEVAEADEASDSADEDESATADEEGADENGGDEEGSDEEGEDDTVGLNQTNVELVVKSQTTGGQIIVETVATARDGWVSVHRSQSDGSILLSEGMGEARVDSGDSEDVIIDLWEAPAIDEKLWVLLHIDAGDRGEYEFPGKDQAVQKNGEIVARSFTIKDSNSDDDTEEDAE
ncbi:MAG: hypothetical protein WA883_09140 [Phormidesmis sp.]